MARFERWDRRWWWLVCLAGTVLQLAVDAQPWIVAIWAFTAGLSFATRFPQKKRRTVGKRRSVEL